MTETTKSVWDQVDVEVSSWFGGGAEAYCLTDKCIEELRQGGIAVSLVNTIGLKRRIGEILKARGYTKTSSSPPTWVLHPPIKPEPVMENGNGNGEIPRWAKDMYLSLLQSEAILEKQYPDIAKLAVS